MIDFPELPGTSLPHHLFHIVFSSPSSSTPSPTPSITRTIPSSLYLLGRSWWYVALRTITSCCSWSQRVREGSVDSFVSQTYKWVLQIRSTYRSTTSDQFYIFLRSVHGGVRLKSNLFLDLFRHPRSSIFFQLNPRDTPLGRTLWHDWKGDWATLTITSKRFRGWWIVCLEVLIDWNTLGWLEGVCAETRCQTEQRQNRDRTETERGVLRVDEYGRREEGKDWGSSGLQNHSWSRELGIWVWPADHVGTYVWFLELCVHAGGTRCCCCCWKLGIQVFRVAGIFWDENKVLSS